MNFSESKVKEMSGEGRVEKNGKLLSSTGNRAIIE
jgi:hypothetical protein